MDKKEFLQRALIAVGAALVKCYDEKCDGIIDNGTAQHDLSLAAMDIADELHGVAVSEGLFDD